MNGKIKLLIAIWALMITVDSALCQPDSLWSRRYMGISSSALLHDGGYAFAGWIPAGEDGIIYSVLSKLNSEGDVIWEDTLETENRYFYYKVIETPDSCIAGFAAFREAAVITKHTMDGELLYSWEFEMESPENITGFLCDGEGGYIVSGFTFVSIYIRDDFAMTKISGDGEIEWQRTYEDRPFDQECKAVASVPNGGYLLVGDTRMNGPGFEVMIIRTDDDGNEIWRNHYGAEMIEIDHLFSDGGRSVVATEDGNLVICGATSARNIENGSGASVLLFKIDPDGELIWMRVISLDRRVNGRSITRTMDGGFVIGGYKEKWNRDFNPLIMKTDHRGNLIWWDAQEEVVVGSHHARHYNALAHEDRTFSLISGIAVGLPPGILIKYGRDPHGVAAGGNGFLPSCTGLESAYPNPFNSVATFVFTVGSPAAVEINIFNGLGRRQAGLVRRSYPIGQHRLSWDAGGLPSGDYFARMTAGGVVSTRKVSLVK